MNAPLNYSVKTIIDSVLLKKTLKHATEIFAAAILLLWATAAVSAPPYSSATIYSSVPPNITSSGAKPMLMLAASKDHTLFGPMFTDFEDLDGDGTIDVTFKPDFKYYGYFDATKCYTYSSSTFLPDTNATVSGGRYVCGGTDQWSGNFLNWATMTRLDIVRKMLYGGQRFTDSSTATILQVARLTRDAHSFVKYYRGTDVRDYTPFTTANLTKTTGSNPGVYAGISMCVRAADDTNGISSTPQLRLAKGNSRLWATIGGNEVCKWSGSFGDKVTRYYGGNAIQTGNSVTYQGNGGVNHEASLPTQSTDGVSYGASSDVNLRVQVCVANKLGEERCQAYGTGSALVYKPVGLLQDFGTPQAGASAARTEFGLITGSYDQNLKAGALRKNMTDLLDEINPTTGQFCFSNGAICPTKMASDVTRTHTSAGAIKALDQINLFGSAIGDYPGGNTELPSGLTNGTLPAWGNPVGEMIVQSLRYYAGLSSTNPTTTTKDAGVSVPIATWVDPMTESATVNTSRTAKFGKPICRPLNILALSSSALSFDADDADTVFADLPNRSRGTLSDFTNAVGAAEGINGTLRSVGSVTNGFGETCAGKTVGTLSNVTGVCPEAPAVGGSYKVAGAALYANTNRIRTPSTLPSDIPAYGLKVKTYAATLAGGAARIEVKLPGTGSGVSNPAKYVYITPEGLWDRGKRMPAAMLTFAAISSSATHGAFIVTWNDTLFGGDYDMDIAGYLRYDILAPLSSSTRSRLKITTDIVNVDAGATGSHGFSILGSNFDGRYLTHRHNNSDSNIASAEGYLCGNSSYRGSTDLSTLGIVASSQFPSGVPAMTGSGTAACTFSSSDTPVTMIFEMTGVDNVILRDPLWYAAKYGAFNPTDATSSTELPDTTIEWDARRNDGRACGGTTGLSCQDGEPDSYFLARRPELLEQQLRDALETIINTTNSAPAVSSSQLSAGGFKYIATFEPALNSGSVLAYPLDSSGNFSATASWDVGQKLATVDSASRKVITNDLTQGVAFATTTTLSTDYLTALRGTGAGALTLTEGDDLINYIRGSRAKEKPVGIWRARSVSSIMGTVINSSPWLQSRPSAQNIGLLGTGAPSYASFITANANRERLLWVGSNDGMLHGFKSQGSDGGAPVLSYVPSPLVGRLRTMAQDGSQIISGMDGSPYTGDVLTGSSTSATWKTYLFSSLGRGGRAVFALDVTTPSGFTEANADSIFKWMFSSDDDSDLGYVLGDFQLHPTSNQATPIVRMNNDKFAILVPNGLGSTSGNAFLYVLFVDGPSSAGAWTPGTHYIKIPTDGVGSNGMMGLNWADTNNDGKVDVIYGTDAKGRLWKFDVSSTTASNWRSAFPATGTPTPLFTAESSGIALAITTAPILSFPSTGGVMIGFGTGTAVTSGSFPDSGKTQRFYSIFDRLNWTARALPNKDLSTLVSRTVIRTSDGSIYVSTAGSIDYASKDGWYLNFPALLSSSTLNNEMVLSSPQLRGNVIYFNTVRPSSANDKCDSGPESTLYALDPLSGTPKLSLLGTITLANGAVINKAGISIADQKFTAPTRVTSKTGNTKIVGKTSNVNLPEYLLNLRRQWREVPGMRTDQ